MFVIDCPRHGSKVLVFETRIRSLTNTDTDIVLDVECWCGQHVTIHTGRDRHDHTPRGRGHPLTTAA
jgi:hypothetical protein